MLWYMGVSAYVLWCACVYGVPVLWALVELQW